MFTIFLKKLLGHQHVQKPMVLLYWTLDILKNTLLFRRSIL